jgi:hypothetical protein
MMKKLNSEQMIRYFLGLKVLLDFTTKDRLGILFKRDFYVIYICLNKLKNNLIK